VAGGDLNADPAITIDNRLHSRALSQRKERKLKQRPILFDRSVNQSIKEEVNLTLHGCPFTNRRHKRLQYPYFILSRLASLAPLFGVGIKAL
jgi:hypothetical protein